MSDRRSRPADTALVAALAERMAIVLPPERGPYPLHAPDLGGDEARAVAACVETGWVSTAGDHTRRFEAMLADATGAAHVVATASGTAALHAGLAAAGIGPGDEVLVPALSFVATANAVVHAGAVPHFVEVEEASLGVDVAKLAQWLDAETVRRRGVRRNRRTGRPVRAMVVMHCLGHPVDLDAAATLARDAGLVLVEDAAEALGSTYRGGHVGHHGLFATLSFNGNKVITTGGGGAVLTGDAGLARRVRHLASTARIPAGFDLAHDEVAWNYRLPGLNAALGVAQLARLADLLAAKRRLAGAYAAAFATCYAGRHVAGPAWGAGNRWLEAFVLAPRFAGARNGLLAALGAMGWECRPLWTPLHRLPMYRDAPRMPAPVAEDLWTRTLCLPSGPALARACEAPHA
ncbi:MAG: aminotransferase class I/II-fold pyridoxal phosphate-dependent enzyme [Alphaproteobacteria bacterium]